MMMVMMSRMRRRGFSVVNMSFLTSKPSLVLATDAKIKFRIDG